MNKQKLPHSFCGQCGAPTTKQRYTPSGWGQTPQSKIVCSADKLHEVQTSVTSVALKLAHNDVVIARANMLHDDEVTAMIRLGNLLTLASKQVREEYVASN